MSASAAFSKASVFFHKSYQLIWQDAGFEKTCENVANVNTVLGPSNSLKSEAVQCHKTTIRSDFHRPQAIKSTDNPQCFLTF
jgi:hypothetical protein